MKSWGSGFGYELIDDNWPLHFPPPDPGLQRVLRQAVAAARVKQEQLIAAAPSEHGRRRRPSGYGVVAGTGGSAGGRARAAAVCRAAVCRVEECQAEECQVAEWAQAAE